MKMYITKHFRYKTTVLSAREKYQKIVRTETNMARFDSQTDTGV